MTEHFLFDIFETPLGPISVVVDREGAVTEIWTNASITRFDGKPAYARDPSACTAARVQLNEYAQGKRKTFDLKLAPNGTLFQLKVWNELLKIPFGETRSYGELAVTLGAPNASRAVGSANGANPISIVVPCHRVIGSTGALIGYGGGLDMKRKLLELEGALTPALSLFDASCEKGEIQ